jgi:glucose-1-phosphatase
MSKKTVRTILFDLGNVIIRFDPELLDKGYSGHSRLKAAKFTDYVMDSDNVNRYMEGKLTSSRFYSRTKKLFKLDISYGDFYRVWNGIFMPYPEMEEILRAVKRGYPEIKLVLVSNTNMAHFDFLKEEYDILDIFDAAVVSHEVGRQKPHPDIFKKALAAFKSLPKETFYTDDRLDLIEAARTMGIRAYHFTDHQKLRSDLSKFNINV